jgi:hypothetical protein
MTFFSKTHRALLTAAAEADDGAIEAPADPKAYATLIKAAYFISLPQAQGPSWLLITDAGRGAIGAPREPTPAAPVAPNREAPPPEEPKGKLGLMVGLLQRPEGAGIADLMAATGWQAHSVRGAIAGSLKKARGLVVISQKTEAGRVYRIAAEAA